MRVMHFWAVPSRWPTGLDHAECNRNVIPIVAIPPDSDRVAAERVAAHYSERLCERCLKRKGWIK